MGSAGLLPVAVQGPRAIGRTGFWFRQQRELGGGFLQPRAARGIGRHVAVFVGIVGVPIEFAPRSAAVPFGIASAGADHRAARQIGRAHV